MVESREMVRLRQPDPQGRPPNQRAGQGQPRQRRASELLSGDTPEAVRTANKPFFFNAVLLVTCCWPRYALVWPHTISLTTLLIYCALYYHGHVEYWFVFVFLEILVFLLNIFAYAYAGYKIGTDLMRCTLPDQWAFFQLSIITRFVVSTCWLVISVYSCLKDPLCPQYLAEEIGEKIPLFKELGL